MANKMKASTLVNTCRTIATEYKTLYVMGAFGAPLNAANKARYKKNHAYNRQASRQAMIDKASPDTFAFDCVNLIKGILWGWAGDLSQVYGGARYASNGVPDIDADQMIKHCSPSSDFTRIVPGEMLWLQGHAGVYIGDGLAVECTPAWKNCVQITAVANIGSVSGYPSRRWTSHGKLPWVDYTADTQPDPAPQPTPGPYNDVPADAWYALDVQWAKDCGIILGVGSGNYAPDSPVTRAQAAAMLHRLYNYIKNGG